MAPGPVAELAIVLVGGVGGAEGAVVGMGVGWVVESGTMEGVVASVGVAVVAVVTGVTVTGSCELETTGDAGWLGEELADAGEMTIVDGGTAGAVGMAEVEGEAEVAEAAGTTVDEVAGTTVDEAAGTTVDEAAGTTEEEGVDEAAGAVDGDGLGGAERVAKSSGLGAG